LEDYSWIFIGLILLIVTVVLAFVIRGEMLYRNQAPIDVNFVLGGLELVGLHEGSYLFNVTLQNPMNYPVSVRWVPESEHSEFVSYSCSLANGTLIDADSNVTSKVDVTVKPNPYGDNVFRLSAKGVKP